VAFPAWSLEQQPTSKFLDAELEQPIMPVKPATVLSQCRLQLLCSDIRTHALREEKKKEKKEKKRKSRTRVLE
jgi:hypothetical protein